MAKRSTVAGTAADPIAEYTPLVIDGFTWKLRYNFNAIALAEKETGDNLLVGLTATIAGGWSVNTTRSLLWAGLQSAHPFRAATKDHAESGVSMETAGSLIRLDTLKSIHTAIVESYIAAMPEKKTQDQFRELAEMFQPHSTIDTSGDSSGAQPESTSDSATTSSII